MLTSLSNKERTTSSGVRNHKCLLILSSTIIEISSSIVLCIYVSIKKSLSSLGTDVLKLSCRTYFPYRERINMMRIFL